MTNLTVNSCRHINGRDVYPAPGVCIYCGAIKYSEKFPARGLATEHIFPLGLAGNMLLPKASCHECEGVTSAIEGKAQRSIFGQLRIHWNFPSRRKAERPASLPLEVRYRDGRVENVKVPTDEFPKFCTMIVGDKPTILGGSLGTHQVMVFHPEGVRDFDRKIDEIRTRYDAESVSLIVEAGYGDILLFLAKIGHAYASALLGPGGFVHNLASHIRTKDSDGLETWIGRSSSPVSTIYVHHLEARLVRIAGQRFIVIEIGFFARRGLPLYDVVIGPLIENADATQGGGGVNA